jgi:hypothetical protein
VHTDIRLNIRTYAHIYGIRVYGVYSALAYVSSHPYLRVSPTRVRGRVWFGVVHGDSGGAEVTI